MFAEAIEDILQQFCTPAQVRAIEGGASAQPLISALEDAGFFALLAPESCGGGNASWRDLHDIVVLTGTWSVPVPLAQTLAIHGLVDDPRSLPGGTLTLASHLQASPGGGIEAPLVSASRTASHVVGIRDDAWVLLPIEAGTVIATGVHGSLTATIHWPAGTPSRALASRVPASHLLPLAALLHAGLLAGAMKRTFSLTMAYANDRMQFGKSIGKFQAIQHQLAVMAEQVAAGSMATEAAFASADGGVPRADACAVAKARASEAAAQVAAIAHGVHGAIGITEEYDLQLSTRRLHEWRMAHGSEAHWHGVLGHMLLDSRLASVTDFVRTLV